MNARRMQWALASGALVALASLLVVQRGAVAQRRRPALAAAPARASAQSAPPAANPTVTTISSVVEGFDPTRARRDGERFVVDLPNGRVARLTLEPSWQRGTAALLAQHQLPRASVVVLDTDTGRVRVYASRAEAGAPDLARDATPPAASVFKTITSGALLGHGMSDADTTCFSGGFHALTNRDLTPDARRDRDCVSLATAYGRSANTVFARRALERLSPELLLEAAHNWGFGAAIPFDAPVSQSAIEVPSERLEFARTAAGFWHSHLSPLHGALLAQAVARGGELQRPFMIEQIVDAAGATVAQGAPQAWRRAVAPEVATALGRMMLHSVTEGTARTAFHDPAGNSFLADVTVGGKTGTLTAQNPFRAYTWFVGNAASSTLRVSFGVMVANDPVWHVKAATLARQVLQVVYRGRATE